MKHLKAFFLVLSMLCFFGGAQPLPPLRTMNGGKDLNAEIHGLNWFGFGNRQTMVDGLWIGGSSMATDFRTIVWRIKLLGFNAIRLPFTFDDLQLRPVNKSIQCKVASEKHIVESCIPPWRKPPSKICSVRFVGVLPGGGVCNGYLENTSTVKRLISVVKTFVENGFYVVLDYHPMGMEPYALQDPRVVANKWTQLLREFKASRWWGPLFKGRLIVDVMNEPDSMRLGWAPVGKLYLATMDQVWSELGKDSVFFMVEGTAQGGYNLNWGDGFVTNQSIIRATGIEDASPFFEAVITKPYRDNVIISPHMYGPSIALNSRAHAGQLLKDRMWNSYMYLYYRGYKRKRFPIVLGEFGSFLTDPKDVLFFNELARYWIGKGQRHWMWWAYNNNSGDTGGLVKSDWQSWEWQKIKYLWDAWGLRGPCT